MPLSTAVKNLKFMQRGANGDTQPTPAITKSKLKHTKPVAAPSEPVASTSKLEEKAAEEPLSPRKSGTIIHRETSMLAFPMLSTRLLGAADSTGQQGRRSFGHFNKEIESLHKPSVVSKGKAPATTSSESSDSSSEDGSDSSIEMIDKPIASPPKPQKRPHTADQPAMGFMKPKLGPGPEARNGSESPNKKKRRKD